MMLHVIRVAVVPVKIQQVWETSDCMLGLEVVLSIEASDAVTRSL